MIDILMMVAQAALAALFTLLGVALYMRRYGKKIESRVGKGVSKAFKSVAEELKDVDLGALIGGQSGGGNGQVDIQALAKQAGIDIPKDFDVSQIGDLAKQFTGGGSGEAGEGGIEGLGGLGDLIGAFTGGKGLGGLEQILPMLQGLKGVAGGAGSPLSGPRKAGYKGLKRKRT